MAITYFHSNTALQLVTWLLELGFGDVNGLAGTATGGSTSTFIDTNGRYESDDYFNSLAPPARILITDTTDDAAPIGEERIITDWVNSSKTGTVSPVFSAGVGSGDTYIIYKDVSWTRALSAINAAIRMVADEMLYEFIDVTTTLVASTYEYAVPSGFSHIYRISMADGNGNYPEMIEPDQWKIVKGTDTAPKIHLIRFPTGLANDGHYYGELFADSDIVATRTLRVEGYKRQAALSATTSICYIDPEYVWHQAAALLHAQLMRRDDSDPAGHKTQMEYHQMIANAQRALKRTRFAPSSRKVFV